MKKEKVKISGIEITLTRKNIKNMYLRILPPDGEVTISAPLFLSDSEIIRFVESKKEWILKRQSQILKHGIKAPLKYKTGETHHVWGREYTLKLIKNDEIKHAFIHDNDLYLPIPSRSTIKKRESILNEFYRRELQKVIPAVLEKCTKIVGRKPSEVKVRKMKNWGNCRYQDKRITLNLNLAKKDPICLEYVMIHELCHLIEFNHGPNFKKLMDEFCPNWREIKKRLNE